MKEQTQIDGVISRQQQIEQDAKYLKRVAEYLITHSKYNVLDMEEWERFENERTLRTYIKQAVQTLMHNLPV